MLVPLPALAPDTPDWATVHEKLVPGTVPASAIAGAFPEQMVCVAGVAVTVGVGCTVTSTLPLCGWEQLLASLTLTNA